MEVVSSTRYWFILPCSQTREECMNNVNVHDPSQSLSVPNGTAKLSSPFYYRKLWYVIFFLIALCFVVGGTVTWILNIVGVLPGPWSNISGALFTGIGISVALLDLLLALIRADGREK